MFTGLIEAQSRVLENYSAGQGHRLVLASIFPELKAGDSLAVNGVCLTVLPDFSKGLSFDISPETLEKTNLRQLLLGELVNLEPAMSAQGRFGGHYVSGHVDKTQRLAEKHWQGDFLELKLGPFEPADFAFLLAKGSLTVEGVSLTINAVELPYIKLLLIPHSLAKTNLAAKQVGDSLNIEFDYLTRVVAQQLALMQAAIKPAVI